MPNKKVHVVIRNEATADDALGVVKLLQESGGTVSRTTVLDRRVIVVAGGTFDVASVKAHPSVQEVHEAVLAT